MKTKINIEEIIKLQDRCREINSYDLEDIEFYENGKKLSISQECMDESRFIGLSNIDFIDMEFYKDFGE